MVNLDFDPFDPEALEENIQALKRGFDDSDQAHRDRLERVHRAFHLVFINGVPSETDRKIVLDHLMQFTRGETVAWHENDRIHSLLTGRQEVWHQIKDFTKLSIDELVLKYPTTRG